MITFFTWQKTRWQTDQNVDPANDERETELSFGIGRTSPEMLPCSPTAGTAVLSTATGGTSSSSES
ncbi:TPA: hypothetical protein ONC18_003333 [Enterobacter kobei]|nr:hypothetical protein [Enterobacter kobei]